MSKSKPPRDPRGHSLRIYDDTYDSAAFRSLSPHDVLAYLALLRELMQYNNGDLSLPLTRAKKCGIGHHLTLARSLRALCAVGLVAVTRKGGCTKGGRRLPNLYRVTDRDCYAMPAKHLEAMSATNEWKRITTVDQGQQLIQAVEDAVKKETAKLKSLGHGVTRTGTPRDVVKPLTSTQRDTWNAGLGHVVIMAENPVEPLSMRVTDSFSLAHDDQSHRTPAIPPLYVATPTGETGSADSSKATAPTTATTDSGTADGQPDRVHDHDLDPKWYDTITGEFCAPPPAPIRRQKLAASRWVESALATKKKGEI